MTYKLRLVILASAMLLLATAVMGGGRAMAETQKQCDDLKNSSFFGLNTWYVYLPVKAPNCEIQITSALDFSDYILIGLAILMILLKLAGTLAVVFVIVGGFKYVTSQAVPERVTSAKNTIQNALIGVVIAVVASEVVAYIANQLKTGVATFGLPNANTSNTGLISIINVALAILGSISFLIITIAGIEFSFSGGEPQRVAKARTAIIYAFVGLIIAIFAAVFVNFVIGSV